MSVNGGPFTAWLTGTTQTSAIFTGQVGDTYGFYSVATDNVGNVQPTPAAAQATTRVSLPLAVASIATVTPSVRNTPVTSVSVTLSEAASLGGFNASALSLTDNGGPNLITSAVTIGLVAGSTYQIGGLSA